MTTVPTNGRLGTTVPTERDPYPVRKTMRHVMPGGVAARAVYHFVTICAAHRDTDDFLDHADDLISAARHYHDAGRWRVRIFLVMPDHLHALVHFPPDADMSKTVTAWKRYLSRAKNIEFQNGYFETRIRDDAHFAEKWRYIVANPVARGLVANPADWPHAWAANAEGDTQIIGRDACPHASVPHGRDACPHASAFDSTTENALNCECGPMGTSVPTNPLGRDACPHASAFDSTTNISLGRECGRLGTTVPTVTSVPTNGPMGTSVPTKTSVPAKEDL